MVVDVVVTPPLLASADDVICILYPYYSARHPIQEGVIVRNNITGCNASLLASVNVVCVDNYFEDTFENIHLRKGEQMQCSVYFQKSWDQDLSLIP